MAGQPAPAHRPRRPVASRCGSTWTIHAAGYCERHLRRFQDGTASRTFRLRPRSAATRSSTLPPPTTRHARTATARPVGDLRRQGTADEQRGLHRTRGWRTAPSASATNLTALSARPARGPGGVSGIDIDVAGEIDGSGWLALRVMLFQIRARGLRLSRRLACLNTVGLANRPSTGPPGHPDFVLCPLSRVADDIEITQLAGQSAEEERRDVRPRNARTR